MRSTRIILHGNEELANQFIRESKVEMYRTEEVAKNAQVTSYQRDTWITSDVMCRTLLTPTEKIIHIFATEGIIVELEEEEESEVEDNVCPPSFMVFNDEAITYDPERASWVRSTDAFESGFFGYGTGILLNEAESASFGGCSVISWARPNSAAEPLFVAGYGHDFAGNNSPYTLNHSGIWGTIDQFPEYEVRDTYLNDRLLPPSESEVIYVGGKAMGSMPFTTYAANIAYSNNVPYLYAVGGSEFMSGLDNWNGWTVVRRYGPKFIQFARRKLNGFENNAWEELLEVSYEQLGGDNSHLTGDVLNDLGLEHFPMCPIGATLDEDGEAVIYVYMVVDVVDPNDAAPVDTHVSCGGRVGNWDPKLPHEWDPENLNMNTPYGGAALALKKIVISKNGSWSIANAEVVKGIWSQNMNAAVETFCTCPSPPPCD